MTEPSNTDLPIDHIRADRACIGCGFNLFGQTVTKEPHYNLAIARCPECGVVASLQNYPTMSHWVNRFRAILAGLWVMALIMFFFIQTSISGTYAFGMSSGAAQIFARTIGKQYSQWAQENGQTVTSPFSDTAGDPYYEWINIPRDWADEHVPALADQTDHWRVLFDSGLFASTLPTITIAFILGIFWSIVLLGGSRKRAAIVPICAACIAMIFHLTSNQVLHFGPMQAQAIAQAYYAKFIGPWVLVIQLPFSLLGIMLGRKIARFVIKLTLPPRARLPLSIFWTRDGLELPKPNYR